MTVNIGNKIGENLDQVNALTVTIYYMGNKAKMIAFRTILR